jgi:hypothetical protein
MGASVVDRLRRPEYTGENRCVPCTVANVAITAGLAAVALFAGSRLADVATGAAAAAVVAVGGLSAIYLRGYLVPYTPQLTKRYLPEWVLAKFDKLPEDAAMAGSEADVDPEPVLLEAGAVELCRGGEDLCPTEAFASAWRAEVERLRADDDALVERVRTAVDADDATVETYDQFALVRAGGQAVARWESFGALLADMAAYGPLAERVPDWEDYDRQARGSLLNGARVFLEQCPACDGPVGFEEETVESCCRSMDVVALSCEACDARLLEVEAV